MPDLRLKLTTETTKAGNGNYVTLKSKNFSCKIDRLFMADFEIFLDLFHLKSMFYFLTKPSLQQVNWNF